MIDLNLKIKILNGLGVYISNIITNNPKSKLDNLTELIINKNRWFDEKSIIYSLKAWSDLLKSDLIEKWIDIYKLSSIKKKKTIALILPGNIPLVGFHDILCVWILDYKGIVKLSSKDDVLIPFLTDYLEKKSGFKSFLYTTSSIKKFDAVIATGSNNSSVYFEYYFSKYPNIIRKNRTSVAVLEGDETELELNNLGKDILLYYGLGCRNVSKIYIPKGFNLKKIFKGIEALSHIINNSKYANNYYYNKSIFLINKYNFLDNGFFLLKKDLKLYAPISCAFYEFYDDIEDLKRKLHNIRDNLQCIVSKNKILKGISFGSTQKPSLQDYADNIDTVKFLINI
tara:strand:+ start:12784 stop:13806 length:1023 start_codon:yes stop_codon:yes gene_type:complete